MKLVTLAPKTVREMTQLPKETQKMGIQTSQKGQINMQNTNLGHTKNTLGPTGLYKLILVAVHMENFQCTA